MPRLKPEEVLLILLYLMGGKVESRLKLEAGAYMALKELEKLEKKKSGG